jgi:hypothetical protein
MRRQYTAAGKAAWNKRYYEKKRKSGWITCSFQVPVSVSKAVQKLKRELMQEYNKARAREDDKTPKAEKNLMR